MKRYFWIIAFLLSPARASDTIDFDKLSRETFDLYPIKVEYSQPPLERISPQELHQWICGDKCPEGIEVKGVYFQGTIYLIDNIVTWDDWEKSLYVHEVVHYIQDLIGKTTRSGREPCTNHLALELEAYSLQSQWLRQHGKFIKHSDIVDLARASAARGCKKTVDTVKK